jgi:hypothetical protein
LEEVQYSVHGHGWHVAVATGIASLRYFIGRKGDVGFDQHRQYLLASLGEPDAPLNAFLLSGRHHSLVVNHAHGCWKISGFLKG